MHSDLLDTINDISRSLATLAFQARAEAQAGLGSRSKIAEHVLLPVFRHLYQAPSLKNTNDFVANFPGIDLYDLTTGLGVQVTSETSSAKIAETIASAPTATLTIKHLVIGLVTDDTPKFHAKSKADFHAAAAGRFAFDASKDILGFDVLLGRIQTLPPPVIAAIADELRSLVRGAHAMHLLPHLRLQIERQLQEEQRITRYIPDVFVETRNTKYQARCFAHPSLFVHRVADWLDREPFAPLNRLLTLSGLKTLETPQTDTLKAADSTTLVEAAALFATNLDGLEAALAVLSGIVKASDRVPRDTQYDHVFRETRYYIESGAHGMQYALRDRRAELACIRSRLFLLTGPAGQGKTNFLCDFANRFLLPHGVPSAYVSTRQLSRTPYADLGETLRKLIFPAAVVSLSEGLSALTSACSGRDQPFVLLIDGLNEHPDLRTFVPQLEQLLEELVHFAHVRVVMTCRSEFLEQRFGEILNGPLSAKLHVSRAHGYRFTYEQYRELVTRYFRFFRVRPSKVAEHVIDFLQRDILLLRFFCEAYGARGKDSTYVQPYVAGVYRDDIFSRYLTDKLSRARQAVDSSPSSTNSLVRSAQVKRVLALVAEHMLENGRFADVPREVVPADLDAELASLLDEELILRHDTGPPPSLLAEPAELLNFTFDEMRDYLLAQHLLAVFSRDRASFDRLLAAQDPNSTQSIEGLRRFLFDASRLPSNRTFNDFYRHHPWYEAVYNSEVFAVRPALLDAEDARIARERLTSGAPIAQQFARAISVRWEKSSNPVLNLDLLLDVARDEGQPFFDNVILPTFGGATYDDGPLSEAFFHFAKTHVLPRVKTGSGADYTSLFRLVVLLLPLDASPTLDSPGVSVLQLLFDAAPGFTSDVLAQELAAADELHRAFLWHFLGANVLSLGDLTPFVQSALSDRDLSQSHALLSHEVAWFLSRCSSAGVAT